MIPSLLLAVLLHACGETADTGFSDTPDIRGHYNSYVTGATGCEGQSFYLNDWAYGPLVITGNGPLDLTYTFSLLGTDLYGTVDDSWSFQLGGSATWTTPKKSQANLQIYEDGMVVVEGDHYKLEGEFSVEVDDDEFFTNDCTLTGESYATQLSSD